MQKNATLVPANWHECVTLTYPMIAREADTQSFSLIFWRSPSEVDIEIIVFTLISPYVRTQLVGFPLILLASDTLTS